MAIAQCAKFLHRRTNRSVIDLDLGLLKKFIYPRSVNDMKIIRHGFARPRHGSFKGIHFGHMHNGANI